MLLNMKVGMFRERGSCFDGQGQWERGGQHCGQITYSEWRKEG